jgi:peptidylprolyl isomerase
VASSRRRERELARRRYERRRLREQQARARRRRRNTIAGATAGTAAVVALIVVLAVTLGGGKSNNAADKITPQASTSASPTPFPSPPTKCAPIKPNPPAAADPKIPPVTGTVPTKLVEKDIRTGHGKAIQPGSKIQVNYVGVSCSTGKVFDASYPRHQPFSLTLGQGQVIAGWDRGLIGMKVGGRRELIIPASDGYGTAGSGVPGSSSYIKPNETLIFVVDLVKAS